MILLGFTWFVSALQAADAAFLYTAGLVLAGSGAASSCTSG